MKNLNKLVALLAFSALASLASAQAIDNWRNANGDVWKNASGDCWRNASWTPATAAPGCGPAPAPAPAPVQEMRSPPNIDELLKNIKQSVIVPQGQGPPAAVPASSLRGNGPKRNAGSTGKNSVVIKL